MSTTAENLVDEEFQELIGLFLDGLLDRAVTLRGAVERGDAKTIRTLAHQLKGSAGGYGYPELGALAARAERECDRGEDPTAIQIAASRLIEGCERTAAVGG